MLETSYPLVVEALTEALETMAFVSLMPLEAAEAPPPAEPVVLVSIAFTGAPASGTIELMAGESFGAMLAANLLGTGPDDPDAAARARDAMLETMNVTCGALIRKIEPSAETFEMAIPQVRDVPPPAWSEFIAAGSGAMVFDADGNTIAVRMK